MIWVTLMGLLSIYRIYWSEPFGLGGSQPWEVRFSRVLRYWVKVMCLLCLASSRVRPIDSLKTGMVRWKLITISHCIHHPPSDVLNCTENKYTGTCVKDTAVSRYGWYNAVDVHIQVITIVFTEYSVKWFNRWDSICPWETTEDWEGSWGNSRNPIRFPRSRPWPVLQIKLEVQSREMNYIRVEQQVRRKWSLTDIIP